MRKFMHKDNILIFTNLFPRPWEPGRAAFNRQQFCRLESFYNINIVVPVAWTDILKFRKQKQFSLQSHAFGGLKISYFPYFFIPSVCRWSYALTMTLSSFSIITKLKGPNKPKCILASWAYPDAVVAMFWGKLFNIPVVIKTHGSDINELPKLFGVRTQIKWALKNCANIIAVSKNLAEKIVALGINPEKVKVIYNGVDTDIFRPIDQYQCRDLLKLPVNEEIVLYIGNLKLSKGCMDLLQAFTLLKQKRPHATLYYVGTGNDATILREAIQSMGLSESVFLIGACEHNQLPVWVSAANVIALASHAEGLPNVLLEAMACGKPVVATNVGGIPEIVNSERGRLVPPHDISGLLDALNSVLEKRWEQDKIIEYVKEFSWDYNIEKMKRIV